MILEKLNIEKYTYISIIGAGGKSSLIEEIVRTTSKKKIAITTTTHILKPEIYLSNITEENVKESFETHNIMTFGEDKGEKLSSPPRLFFDYIDKYADLVLIEADGAKRFSFKAPNKREPVIIKETQCTILIVGISVLGKNIDEYCHRPELIKEIVGEQMILTVENMAKVIIEGYLKKIKGDVRIVINQADDDSKIMKSLELAKIIEKKIGKKAVVMSLQNRRIIDVSGY